VCWTSPATSLAHTARRSLGDLGAEVIKIEAHRGDQTRYYPSTPKGQTRMFLGVNRNKQGVVLDLKHEAAREIVYKLTETADVAVENFRPGVAERLQIGYEQLAAINPRLIYCSISGYGSRGPMQAMTGIAVSQGGDGAPQVQGGSVVDYYTATLAAYGVMAALFVREHSPIGQKVETSLLQGALTMQASRASSGLIMRGVRPNAISLVASIVFLRRKRVTSTFRRIPRLFGRASVRRLVWRISERTPGIIPCRSAANMSRNSWLSSRQRFRPRVWRIGRNC
jgi:CoA-transferase family III